MPATRPLREGRAAGSSLSGLSAPTGPVEGPHVRRRARAAESARLEIVCGETHRGFKSHRLRHMGTDAHHRRPGEELAIEPAEELAIEEAMGLALEEAALAVSHGDVPVGAVALFDGRVIASRHNEREKRGDPTAHAELLALADAAAALGTWRLSEVTLVVTLEPCPMCAGALVAGPGGPAGLRSRRPQGRGVRIPLQPVRRPPPQPRGGGRARGPGRRGVGPSHQVLRRLDEAASLLARRDARVAESDGLENRCVARHRGFESHSLRSSGLVSG